MLQEEAYSCGVQFLEWNTITIQATGIRAYPEEGLLARRLRPGPEQPNFSPGFKFIKRLR